MHYYLMYMLNIQETQQKIKNWTDHAVGEWGLVCIVFLVAFASFALGRLSALEDARPLVSVSTREADTASPMKVGGLVVASRSGSSYHYPWCAGAAQIAEKNRMWFQSEAEAQRAGYRPAKNCKGLAQPAASSQ